MSNARHRIVFGVLLVVLGALAALVASAYIVDRGHSKILAGIVGALAFPVLPVAWHAWGERRRARRMAAEKKPKPNRSAMTGADRYWVRFGIVVLAVIGPMIYKGRGEVARAAWRHGLWFLPEPVPGFAGHLAFGGPRREFPDQESLLRRVPSDSEAVVIWHDAAASDDTVIAFGGHQAMGVGRPTFPRETYERFAKTLAHYVPLEPLSVVPNTDDLELQSTDGWRAKVEPPAGTLPPEIRRELVRAPLDAAVAIGIVPHGTPSLAAIKHGFAWAAVRGDRVVIEARVVARDMIAANQLLDAAQGALHGELVPDACKASLAKLQNVDVALIGLAVVAHLEATPAVLRELAACVDRS